MAQRTPSGLRLHVGLVGRRNVGKSSLINALTGEQVAIVAPQPGTTTDPIFKPFEDHTLGPVLLIDTAGLDDEGEVGLRRVERSRRIVRKLDVALLVVEAGRWGAADEALLAELRRGGAQVIVVENKVDLGRASLTHDLGEVPVIRASAKTGEGLEALRAALSEAAAGLDRAATPVIASDLVGEGEVALLVVPVDNEAPAGRLILPQVQCLRDLLDRGRLALVTRDVELDRALAALRRKPALVITDSQAIERVAELLPRQLPLTTFSVLFARLKGDLAALTRGAEALEALAPGDEVLIAEACSHHPVEDDIAREKLPRWLEAKAGGALNIRQCRGRGFPEDLGGLSLVVHCGGCTLNRREALARIGLCAAAEVPITNFGLAIASCFGLLKRVLEPFDEVGRSVEG